MIYYFNVDILDTFTCKSNIYIIGLIFLIIFQSIHKTMIFELKNEILSIFIKKTLIFMRINIDKFLFLSCDLFSIQ